MKKIIQLLILSSFVFSFAQGNNFSGTVIDKESNLPIPGANIVLIGTSQGVISDFDGV
ncbi:MAG: iron complex outermembrane receptor protein, partial [Arcticibacterium sp.]